MKPKPSAKFKLKKTPDGAPIEIVKAKATGGYLEIGEIKAEPDTQVYRLALRTWLAPVRYGRFAGYRHHIIARQRAGSV